MSLECETSARKIKVLDWDSVSTDTQYSTTRIGLGTKKPDRNIPKIKHII